MMIVPMKVQEIDDLSDPNPINQVPRSSAEEEGESQSMEGIIVLDPPVKEKDHPYGCQGNNNEKDGS